MNIHPLVAAALGLGAMMAGFGGLTLWSTGAPTPPAAGWRPACAAQLGLGDVDVVAAPATGAARTTLLGLDLSPSNRVLADAQTDAVVAYVSALGAEHGTGVLLVSDRSDRSSTPDLPILPAQPARRATVVGPACWPSCPSESLAQQRCAASVQDAAAERVRALDGSLLEQARHHLHERQRSIAAWRADVGAWTPGSATSLLRFWHKVADLPIVRRDPAAVRVVLLSDLQEAGTPERARIERWGRRAEADGACPPARDLPDLSGVEIVLLQTVTDRVDAPRWGARWEHLLDCAGARVARHRYSPSIPIAAYLDADHPASNAPALGGEP